MPHVLISKKKCTGCHECELACSAWHEGAFQPSLARLTVLVEPTTGAIEARTCMQTACHKCQDVCPRDAIETRDGVLYVAEALCDGCASRQGGAACVDACPWHVIDVHPRTGKAFKCDLCDGDPRCVAFCQNPYVLAIDVKKDRADGASQAPSGGGVGE
jgi:carbon-monoxide dehydrogenase iron sulfur subunit